MGAARTKHPRRCTYFILQTNQLLNSNNWGTQVYFFSWMKEDFVLTQLAQGHDRSLLGTYATTSSIVVVILTFFFLSVPLFISKARLARANYIFLKLFNILDTIENSWVHTCTHQSKQMRETCCTDFLWSLVSQSLEQTSMKSGYECPFYLPSNHRIREEIEVLGFMGACTSYNLYLRVILP